jgi:hypothetical protein
MKPTRIFVPDPDLVVVYHAATANKNQSNMGG